MKISLKILSLLLLIVLNQKAVYPQILNGRWKGGFQKSIFVLNPVDVLMELEITNDTVISGVIHNYFTKGRYSHDKVYGIINWKDSIFDLVDGEVITHNINSQLLEECPGTMRLKLTKNGNVYRLTGKWKDNNKKLFHCPTLEAWFEKEIPDLIQHIEKNVLTARRTDVQKLIELVADETDSIKLSLYDNGEIDNDTVSVYFNDSLILKSLRLSQTPFDFYISLDRRNKMQKIKLVAENLGSIPPNTALLVITTKKDRYTITLSSDYSKNGSVELFLKE